jgi:hypothetical protein
LMRRRKMRYAAPYILEFMKVPQDVWNAALIYTRVVFLGTLGILTAQSIRILTIVV